MIKKINFLLLVLASLSVHAQPAEKLLKVIVTPNHENWTADTKENISFDVSVYKNNQKLNNLLVTYEVGLEKQLPFKKGQEVLKNGLLKIDAGQLNSPGFLRCIIEVESDGKKYRGLSTVAVSPFFINPTIKDPVDFDDFWERSKDELSKIPVDAKMILLPEKCTEKVNVYQVNLQNYRLGSRLYGILCIPKKEGKYPALLQVPGAGVRPYNGDVANAEKGIITFQIGIHGIPVIMDPAVYADLGNGVLNGYPFYHSDDKDLFYFKRVYLGCIRANDFLTSLPQFDGKNLAVTGGSQGGALSIVTAALDNRVKYLGAYYPALCDLTGYLFDRAGGWPHYFTKKGNDFNKLTDKVNTLSYYDVVNFAKRLKVPGRYTWGFNDETCPPTSMYAAYNGIKAKKELLLFQETGHWTYPEQNEWINKWIVDKLKDN